MPQTYIYEDDVYFNPQLHVGDLEKKAMIEDTVRPYRLTIEQCESLRTTLADELTKGLLPPKTVTSPKDGDRLATTLTANDSKFPMFNSFVTKLPKSQQTGHYLGLDIGGTNMRIIHLELYQKSDKIEQNIGMHFYDVPREVRQSNTTEFFGFLAQSLKKTFDSIPALDEFVRQRERPISMGFTFSFGTEQTSINSGRVLEMGIQTYLSDIFGKCPVELFQRQIDASGVPVKIVALANDCCTTLLYAIQLKPDTVGGLILGSGTNISYIEKIANFPKYTNPPADADEVIVVSEFCYYGHQGELDQYITKWDLELDRASLIPKSYVYEKLVGGAFQGELLRLTLLELAKMSLLMGGNIAPKLFEKETISTADMSLIEAEAERIQSGSSKGPNKEVVKLLETLGYSNEQIGPEDVATVVYVCSLITVRAALFTATALSVFVDHIAKTRDGVIRFGCDGSYFKKHPKMSNLINSYLRALSPNAQSDVFVADQGSGIGSAVLATCYD